MTEWWLLLLPFAAASGWYACAKRATKTTENDHTPLFSKKYFTGLQYLLSEQDDKAVDLFVDMLKVDSETVETHLALGHLFRKRGEVNRAIRIHQNLIARPQLTRSERAQALLALGQDYMSAGMHDRAEHVFIELVMLNEQTEKCLHNLLTIYQQEQAWEKAIDVASQISRYNGKSQHKQMAHFYCELAELTIGNNDIMQARRHLKRALAADSQCVRASLLNAQIDMQARRYKNAIRHLLAVKHQDSAFLPEILPDLITCYEQTPQSYKLLDEITALLKEHPHIMLAIELTKQIEQEQGVEAASNFLTTQLAQRASLHGLQHLLELQAQNIALPYRDRLYDLAKVIRQLTTNAMAYQCIQCGFSSKKLHWQCLGCKQWSTVKPIQTLEVPI
ncbi:MAG: lipopolysaccharide assembly protein LapB [Gammaproteobacteria bacterium]